MNPAGVWLGLQTRSRQSSQAASLAQQVPTLPGPWLLANGSSSTIKESQLEWCNQLAQPTATAGQTLAGNCVQAIKSCRTAVSASAAGAGAAGSAAAAGLNNYHCVNALSFICQKDNGCPASCGASIRQMVHVNIRDFRNMTVRADSATKYAYMASGNGMMPPERFILYKQASGMQSSAGVIRPGNTAYMRSVQTNQYCRLVALTGPAASAILAAAQVPPTCLTQGLLCDQASQAAATPFTYTGSGLSFLYNPLVALPGTGTLVLSREPPAQHQEGRCLHSQSPTQQVSDQAAVVR